jgi:hypothetical protein
MRPALLLGAALALAASALPATAQGDENTRDENRRGEKQSCIEDHARGQALRKDGRLLDATRAFASCASVRCPSVVQAECARWHDEVTTATPTVVIDAVDPTGESLSSVAVRVDGRPVVDRLDGRPIAIDPGEHDLVLEADGGGRGVQRVLLLEGIKNRTIRVALGGPARRAEATDPRPGDDAGRDAAGPVLARKPAPWIAYPLAAVGLAGIAGFATFGLLGRDQQSKLDDCRGACRSHDDYVTMRDRYLAADISLAVGVLSLGAAAVVWLSR